MLGQRVGLRVRCLKMTSGLLHSMPEVFGTAWWLPILWHCSTRCSRVSVQSPCQILWSTPSRSMLVMYELWSMLIMLVMWMWTMENVDYVICEVCVWYLFHVWIICVSTKMCRHTASQKDLLRVSPEIRFGSMPGDPSKHCNKYCSNFYVVHGWVMWHGWLLLVEGSTLYSVGIDVLSY